MERKSKNPVVAGAMNFFLFGAGYLYLGIRVRFGVLLLASYTLAAFAPLPDKFADLDQATIEMIAQQPFTQVMLLSALFLAGALAYDAYSEAKLYNRTIPKQDA